MRAWKRVAARMPQRRPLLVLADCDGTLASIAGTPHRARVPGATRVILASLSRQPGVCVGVVSGRSLREIKRLIGVPHLLYAGNHGLEFAGPGFAFLHPGARAARPRLRRLARRLEEAIRRVPGALVEWKGLTVSLHWRRVPKSAQRKFHRVVDALVGLDCREGRVRVTYGKRVVEVRPPVNWDKGAMVEWIVHRLAARHKPRRPWLAYLGDDQTDEDAFRSVNRLRGLSVFVGRPRRDTRAGWWLRNPREVRAWLVELNRLCRRRHMQEGGRP